MPRSTKFSPEWLTKVDRNGDKISEWCRESPSCKNSAFCKICDKHFSVANMGFSQLLSHSDSAKHIAKMKSLKSQSTLVFAAANPENEGGREKTEAVLALSGPLKKTLPWVPACEKEKILRAEAIVLMTAIKCNLSFVSMGEIATMCSSALDDSAIGKGIKLSDTKARYVTKFGLAPYFRKQTFLDLGNSYFTLYFDKTTSKQVKKQLDVYISYWSEKLHKINIFYADSFFLGHAEADKLLEIFLKFLSDNDLQLEKILQCSSDGPRVNLSFKKKLNSFLAAKGINELLDVGTCVLHQIHTSLKKGIKVLNCEVDDFALNVFGFFKLSAARREDFHNIQVELLDDATANHFFQRHVESRWMTLGPVCERLIEQYSVLKEYFLSTLPKRNTNYTSTSDKYVKICTILKDPNSLIYFHIVCFICNIFKPYLLLFQSETPLIHVMFEKLNELVRKLMLLFLKPEVVGQKEGLPLVNIDCKDGNLWVSLKNIEIGTGAKKLLSSGNHKDILHNMRSVYITMCEYLQKMLPLTNTILQDLRYIHPNLKKNTKSKEAVSRLVLHFKVCENNEICDRIKSEFQMYMCDESEDVVKASSDFSATNDICKYWSCISTVKDNFGNLKFYHLVKFIKVCLTLSHSNAVPERGFSINNNIVTKERSSLSEIGIRSLRFCRDYLKKHSLIHSLVTKEMIRCMDQSYAKYAAHLEQMKTKQAQKRKLDEDAAASEVAQKKEKEDLQDIFKKLTSEEADLRSEEKAAHALSNEASEKLLYGIRNNDIQTIKVGQMMLETANGTIKSTGEKLSSIQQKKSEIEKKIFLNK